MGCSFEPVMDCADEHPDAIQSFCEANTIKPVDTACAEVLGVFNACVLAAKEQQ